MSRLSKFLPRSEFARHVVTLMTGSTISQIIPFAVLPILSRLYSREQFGLMSLYVSLSTLLTVVATARLELAIVLPRTDKEAAHVGGAVVLFSSVFSLLLTFVVWIDGPQLARLFDGPHLQIWLWLTPLSVLLLSLYQVLTCWANRHKRYAELATAAVVLQIFIASSRILIGRFFAEAFLNGLIWGLLLGQASAVVVLWHALGTELKSHLRDFSFSECGPLIRSYKKFPLFNVPYSLLGTFSRDLPIYLLSTFGFMGVAGAFGLARSIISAPITFLSASLGQVFFQKAAVSTDRRELEGLVISLMRRLNFLFCPLFCFFMFWAPQVFTILFGEQWTDAGKYSAMYAPATFLFLFTSWPERMFEVTNNQHASLCVEIISDVLLFALLWTALKSGVNPQTAVLLFAIGTCCYHVAYLTVLFRISDFQKSSLFALGREVVMTALATISPLLLLRGVVSHPLLEFGFGIMLLAIYFYFLSRRFIASRNF